MLQWLCGRLDSVTTCGVRGQAATGRTKHIHNTPSKTSLSYDNIVMQQKFNNQSPQTWYHLDHYLMHQHVSFSRVSLLQYILSTDILPQNKHTLHCKYYKYLHNPNIQQILIIFLVIVICVYAENRVIGCSFSSNRFTEVKQFVYFVHRHQ